MPGPPPKRSEERTRRGEPASGPARHGELRPVKIPNADPKWHKRAKAWYASLKTSGMADFYQDSDWTTAQIIADYITLWYERPRAMDMANITGMMGKLGSTEGDRRATLRIELSEPAVEEQDAQVVAIAAYKDMLAERRKAS